MPHLANSSQPQSSPDSRPATRQWPGRLLLAVLLALLALCWWQRQAISDWIQLYGYKPPAAIAKLADQTTMTHAATHLFYLNKPIIADRDEFDDYCSEREQSIVLGCYHPAQDGIYLLQIDKDSELHGVMQVTAAHEMLHAAYDRLSDEEKQHINKQLQEFYRQGLKYKAVKREVDAYRQTEPDAVVNEMHSIFGTEIADLPTELEQYYARYFSDRQAVVGQAERYQAAFRQREAAVTRYDAQLAQLQQSISQHQGELATRSADLERRSQELEQHKRRGDVAAYNAGVAAYNQAADQFNQLLATTKQEIAEYNRIVKLRNALVVEEQELMKQLSGQDLPASQ